MLEKLKADDFEGQLKKKFKVKTEDGSVSLKLVEVERLENSMREAGGFSLIFQGPFKPALEQGVHKLNNKEIGKHQIFIVPIGPAGDELTYQAIFN